MELDPELISVGPGSRMDRNNMLSRRDKQQSRKVFVSLVPKKNYFILYVPASMTLQMNSIPFVLLRVTYSFLCDILILFNIVNALPCHEHILLSES